MAQDIKVWTVDIGNYTGSGLRPLWLLPNGYGGISVLGASLAADGAGTSVTANLIYATNVGTPVVAGTIGSFAGTVTFAESVTAACTIATKWVDDNQWIGLEQASGTAATHTWLTVNYVEGRGA